MKPLAMIPARAGSKRLPDKNRMKIGGFDLWEYAVLQAQSCGLFGPRVWVTTDYVDIVTASWADLLDPFHAAFRGPDLAADDTPMMAVVNDVITRARRDVAGEEFDAVVLLQPTSPLRSTRDIRACVDMLGSGVDAVVSVVSVPEPELYTVGHAHRMRPISMHRDGMKLYAPNGAIFAITTRALDAGYDWWSAPVVSAYEMPLERSVDIDTAVDLERARELWALQQR